MGNNPEVVLEITKSYSEPMQGGRKYNQRGGRVVEPDYLDFTRVQNNEKMDGMALTEDQAATLIGYLPEPFITDTWDKLFGKQKIEVTPKQANDDEVQMKATEGTDDEPNIFMEGSYGEEGELYTEIDLEQNLIMGIRAYCWMNGVPAEGRTKKWKSRADYHFVLYTVNAYMKESIWQLLLPQQNRKWNKIK